MRILVTGGAGFIGSHLTELLIDDGHEVVTFDDLSTGDLANLERVRDHPNHRFVEGTILDRALLGAEVAKADKVVHLAAAVGVKLIMEQPLASFTTNTKGAEAVFDACLEHDKALLLASTSEVYGKNTSDELIETSDRVLGATTVKRWTYAASKAFDEMMALMLAEERGLDVTIIRFFNTVGPRQSPAYGMVIPSLAKQAVAGEPMTVHGDGLQTRCFCHVSDTVRAVSALVTSDRPSGEVFNVGRPEEISILDLASAIRNEASSDSLIITVPYAEAFAPGFEDMRRRMPSIQKINEATGWSPVRSMDQIVADAVSDAKVALRSPAISAH